MIINSAKYSCAAGHEINEDSCLCSAEKGIFIVADGLGGHSKGERASMAAVDYFEENCRGGYTAERVSELLEGANIEVLKNGDGGKTTVAAAFTENGNFIYANAGDSRVYYFRDGKIIAQTKDHSVCQASVDMGMLRPEDIRSSEDRSRLLKVLGSEEKLNIKKRYPPIRIQSGDAFLVCSDGFWEYVYETEMEADLLKSDNSEAWLKYMLKRHILRSENKGDNYTAVCGIIYLDGSETYIPYETEKSKPEKASDVPKSRGWLAAAAAAGVLLIAAVVCLSFFLHKDSGTPDTSETVTVTETETLTDTATETETETVTETETETDTVTETVTETETKTDTVTVTETSTDSGEFEGNTSGG